MDDRWQVSPRDPRSQARRQVSRRVSRARQLRSPTGIILTIAVVGSIGFLIYALTLRDMSQVPLLSAGCGVLGIVFAALTVAGGVATYQAGRDGRSGRALGLAVLSGIAALISSGSFAAAVILAIVINSGQAG